MRHIRVLAPWRGAGDDALLTTSCSLVGGDDDGGDDASKRVVLVTHESFVMSEGAAEAVRGGERLRPGGPGLRRRRRAHQQAGAHQGRPDRRRGVRHRQHLRRRGRIDEGVLAPYAAKLPDGADQYALAGRRRPRPHAGRHRQRLRQRRRHLVRRPRRRPSRQTLDDLVKPAYKDLFVTPGATTSSPGLAFLLATIAAYGEDGWQDYWSAADGQRHQAHPGLVGRLRGRLHPGRRQAATGRSCCPTTPRRRSPSTATGGTTTSALLDTCFRQVEYAGVLAGAENPDGRPGAGRLHADAGRSRRRCRTRCTSSRSTRRRRAAAGLGEVREAARPTRTRSTRPRSPSTATSGCATWSDVTSQ